MAEDVLDDGCANGAASLRRGDPVKIARRDLGALLLLPALHAWAQSPPRIAWIWPGSESGELPRSSAFKEGMRENGMVQGRHYVLDERYADGNYERFPAIIDELLALKPAILMVNTIASVRVAQRATQTVPIVFVATNDPLGSGLISSYARPGGNTTGLSSQNEDTAIKNLQLARELLPRATRLASLVNPGNPSGQTIFESLQAAARRLGIVAFAVELAAPEGLDGAFKLIMAGEADALLAIPDAMFFNERERIAALALKHRLPLFATNRESTAAGGLLSYGQPQLVLFRRSAGYVKNILAGVRPADLPVEQPTRFELVINLKTAKALGLTIPQALLLRADEVIE